MRPADATRSETAISDGRKKVAYTGVVAVRRKRGARCGGCGGCGDPSAEPSRRLILSVGSDPALDVEEHARRLGGGEGIEAGSRMIEAARPKTRSRNAALCISYFCYGVMMLNARVTFGVLHESENCADSGEWGGTSVITQGTVVTRLLLEVLPAVMHPKPLPEPPP